MSDPYNFPAESWPAPADHILAMQRQAAGIAMSKLDDDPEKAARAQELSTATGTDPALVYGNLEGFEKQHKAALTSQLLSSNKFLQSYVDSHPLAASVSNDDWGNLDKLSESVMKIATPITDIPHEAWETTVENLRGLRDAILPKSLGGQREPAKESILQGLSETSGMLLDIAALPFSPVQGAARSIIGHPLTALMDTLRRGAVALHGEDKVRQAEEALKLTVGGMTYDEARGIADKALMTLGESKVLSHISAVRAAEPYLRAGEKPPLGLHPVIDEMYKEQAKIDAKNRDDAYKDAQATQTGERSPEMLTEFIRQHPEAKIGVTADAVRKLYGDEVPTAEDGKLGYVPNLAEQLRVAEATGGHVEIPLADWLAKTEPEVAKGLKDDIKNLPGVKGVPDGLTLNEAKDLGKLKVSGAEPVELKDISAEARVYMDKSGKGNPDLPMIDKNERLFEINADGKKGQVIINPSEDGKTLRVRWVEGEGGSNSIGTGATRQLLREVQKQFPNAEYIEGERVTGARGETAPEVKMRLPNPAVTSIRQASSLEPLFDRDIFQSTFIPEDAVVNSGAIQYNRDTVITPQFSFPAKSILAKIDPSTLTGVPRALFEFFGDKLGKMAGEIPTHIISRQDMGKITGKEGVPGLHSLWSDGFEEIYLTDQLVHGDFGRDTAAHVIVHEIVHGATIKALEAEPALRKSVRAMMDEAEEFLNENDPASRGVHDYAWTNEEEFIAEAFSKPDFQEVLATTPISPELAKAIGLKSGARTVWDAVREIIGQLVERLTGIKPPDTILDGMLHIGKIIEGIEGKEKGRAIQSAAEEQMELPGMTRLESRELFAKANAIGMTVKQYKQYMKLIEDRRVEDVEFQKEQAEKEERLHQTAEWKENEGKVRAEVKADVQAKPDIAADEFLRTGTLHGEKLKGRVRLDADKLTAEQKASLPEDYVKKGGADPDDVAGLFGYQTGGNMIEHLAQLQKDRGELGPNEHVNALVKAETERRMKAQFGDLEQNILNEAKDHVVSQTQLDLLHEEVLHLGMQSGGEMSISKAVLKSWAKTEFDQTPISRHSTDKYLASAGKAGRTAELALLDNDATTAFKAKQQQYLSMLLANEAKKLEKQRGQFEKLAKRMSKREVPSVPQEYTNFVHDIFMRVGQQVKRSVQDLQEGIAHGEHKTLEEFVNYKEGHDLREVPVADFLLDPGFRKNLPDLTAEQFRAVHDSVKTLVKNGRDELKIEKEGAEADLAEVRGKMVEQLETLKEQKIDVTKSARKGIGHVIRVAWASLLQMESIFNRWDRGDPNGIFTQYVMRPLAEAANFEGALERKYSRQLKGIADKTNLNEKVNNTIFKSPLDGELMQFTRKNLRAVLQNVGNSSNMEKLSKGYGEMVGGKLQPLEPQLIMDWLHRTATKADWDWVQKQGDIFAGIKKESDRMYRRISGIESENIHIDPIQTPHGTYDGWYHPAVYDPRFEGSSKKLMGGDALEQDNFVRATTPRGYTKQRTGYTAPISLDLDMTPSRMKSMLHDIAFREAIMQASKIFYAKDVRAAVTKHYGLEYRDMLVPYLRDVANSANFRSDAQAVGAGVSEFLRQNIIGTLIGFNPGTVLKHGPTAAMNSITEVGPKNFLRAVKDLLQTNDQTGQLNWNFAMTTSEELQRRHRNYVETLKGAQQQVIGESSLRDTVLKLGATPVAISDLLSAVPTWLAQYRNSVANGAEHGTATFEADRAVRRAHGSSVVTNRPAAMRGGQMAQWVTSLYGFFSHMLNRQFEMMWQASDSFQGAKKGNYEEATKHLPSIAAGFFSYIIFPALIEEMVTPLSNDEHESWGKWAALTVAKGVSSSWPIIRDLADYGLSQGRREPSIGLFSSTAKSVGDVMHDLPKGREMFNKAHAGTTIQHGLTAFGAVSGLTNAQEGRSARFIYNYATGQEHPKDAGAWWRGLRSGTSKPRR